MQPGLIFDIVGLCFYAFTLLISLTMTLLIAVHLRRCHYQVPILLIGNTYVILFLFSVNMLVMYGYNTTGTLDPTRRFDGLWCRLRTYFVHVLLCALYYSFVLQATFRLLRIVFYRQQILQSVPVFVLAAILQWTLSVLFTLSSLLLNDFQYLPKEYNCWIDFENLRGLLILMFVIYGLSTSIILSMYVYIIRYVQQTRPIHQRQHLSNKRDVTILRRIVILVTIIVGLGFPTVAVILVRAICKFAVPFDYHIQGVSLSIGAFIASISLVFLTPRIREIFRMQRNDRRIPTIVAMTPSRHCSARHG